jgi:hypothetical protein
LGDNHGFPPVGVVGKVASKPAALILGNDLGTNLQQNFGVPAAVPHIALRPANAYSQCGHGIQEVVGSTPIGSTMILNG